VLLKAQTRARERSSGRLAMIEEILLGRPARPLPASVEAALAALG
jgi:hypothetical protein